MKQGTSSRPGAEVVGGGVVRDQHTMKATAGESEVLLKRKEASSKEDTQRRAEMSAALMKERKQKLLRERELKIKRRKLVNRLEMRPRDQKSLMQLFRHILGFFQLGFEKF